MKPEQYFFRYAWPCAEVLLQLKRISQERFDELGIAAEKGITPSREILEDTYKVAFNNIKKIAEQEGKDYWDISVIKIYFEGKRHNKFINSGHGTFGKAPESIKDMCRIIDGKVNKVSKDIVKVSYNNKIRMCRNIYKLKLKKGDTVRMHYGYIIDKIK